MKTWLIILLLGLAVVLGNLPGIIAESSAGPLCEYRSAAHIAEHGGFAADNAWHIAHGDLPTCDTDSNAARRGDDRNDDRDKKSRFCRKRWWC
ncbi:hypothetical protein SEA_KERBEROS_83 [Mycobacterium phage Kerberos]|uniref:site-specific recombination directionality factor RDF n=1 Tax=Mycobacterium phage Chy5 TaxID=1327948 RepID=UPI00032B83F2|nr:site-specific recombination directionality factor RDF [Mycobacterium phage Chy5]AOQ27915.1 hypothetical protein SEA_POMAR16_83 [Mycobacterium phage Pomar16]APC43131.1 hypothetical protein SEA_KERBEROS_83 [Mycobacterium phage Kerberos]APC46199.1 hypothetical protein PBI_STARSTUFF_83 [Mycobacterium phage StarStuff]AXH48944.1 hypothetical protein SEA_TOMATHAN_83 [Mycobacterium phage Tomathan]QBP28741.1 hypothetical protein SEA_DBQU4N_83 [Mycobacterium phage DBQu4n]QJD51870.1 hypothetical prot